jgi:hypothetical protein
VAIPSKSKSLVMDQVEVLQCRSDVGEIIE